MTTEVKEGELSSKYEVGNQNIVAALQDGTVTNTEWSVSIMFARMQPRLVDALRDVSSTDPSLSQAAEKHINLLAKACAVRGGGQGDENYIHMAEGSDMSNLSEVLKAREKNEDYYHREPEEIVLKHFVDHHDAAPNDEEKEMVLQALGRMVDVDMTILSYAGKKEDTRRPEDVSLFLTRIKNATSAAKEIVNRAQTH